MSEVKVETLAGGWVEITGGPVLRNFFAGPEMELDRSAREMPKGTKELAELAPMVQWLNVTHDKALLLAPYMYLEGLFQIGLWASPGSGAEPYRVRTDLSGRSFGLTGPVAGREHLDRCLAAMRELAGSGGRR